MASKDDLRLYSKMIDEQFFIDTNGKIKRWKWGVRNAMDWISLHSGIAERLFPDAKDPVTYVHDLGWITVGSSCYTWLLIKNEPTQAQINTLFDLGLKGITNTKGERFTW